MTDISILRWEIKQNLTKEVNTGLDDGLVPSGNKPLSESILTQI